MDDARSLSAVMGAMDQPPEVAKVEDRVIPGPAGDLPVRIYTPDAPAPRPVIAFFHGGGFVICSVDTHDGLARRLANATGAVVVSVEYRLAPEVRCPDSAEDCYAATLWTHEHAGELGADPGRLVVAGDERGWQPRRRRRADGERAEHATDHRPGARVPGHRRRLRRAVVHGERRGLLPRGDRDALVLGPLSRTRRRRRPPPCVTDPRERSVRLAAGSRDHGRVRPAARRGRGVRRRIGRRPACPSWRGATTA